MKYIDYREKLGIGPSDETKFKMFHNKVRTAFDLFERLSAYIKEVVVYSYFSEIGERPNYPYTYNEDGIRDNISHANSINEIICKLVILLNTLNDQENANVYRYFSDTLYNALEDLRIPYEIINDDEGSFIFPKGAKELDNALVSEPLEWLKQYPQTRKKWIDALKDYSNLDSNNASDVAEKFRKALERFFQEFFNTTKALENLKSEYGNYMKSKGVPPEISNNLETLQQCYTNFMNNYAKHHDKTSENLLEYIMYQTGNIIRLIITLK